MTWFVRLIGIISFIFYMQAFADVNDASVKVEWGYKGNKGPARWGQLSKAFSQCSLGKEQSPINIQNRTGEDPNKLTIHYEKAPMQISHDGRIDLMLGNTETIVNNGHTIQLDYQGNARNEMINYGGKDYSLVQFHFHTPSETQIHRQSFPLEIHFVHQSKNGRAAVVAVLVKAGAANTSLQTIIDHLPKEKNNPKAIGSADIAAENLLPARHHFYSFDGSLTTPPCTEGLQWLVMADTITATPAQILEMRKAIGADNARPVQPLNKRDILYSKGT